MYRPPWADPFPSGDDGRVYLCAADDDGSKAADELSIASVTRGIENPNPRTCLVQIKCGIADWMAMLIAVAFFIFELCMRGRCDRVIEFEKCIIFL